MQTEMPITKGNMPEVASAASSDQASQSDAISASAPSAASKLNASFTSSGGVRAITFKLAYDPELVTVMGVEPGVDLPKTAQVTLTCVPNGSTL